MTSKKTNGKSHGLGSLTAEAQMEIHSVETMKLWSPAKKLKQVSVGGFLSAVSVLEHAARQDDPYADYALLEIESALDKAFTLVNDTLATLPPLVSSRLRFSEALCRAPMTKMLRIGSRFGWRLVALLEAYDVLMVRLYDAQFKAQLNRIQFEQHKSACVQAMRHVLNQSKVLRHSGVTRQDVAANNAKAIQAQEKFGAIPLEVLEGLDRAQFAPEIKGATHG